MYTLNLGLQCVGLMSEKMDDNLESEASKCKSLKELRDAAKRKPCFQEEAIDSVSHVKVLLTQIFECLQLKGKKFTVFNAASPQSIKATPRAEGEEVYCLQCGKSPVHQGGKN